jgi:hypothetical protein
MANEQNLKPFKKGEVANPNGRPRKYITQLKEQGYKISEVNDCIQVLMSMNEAELNSVLTNDKATILEKTVANAMIKSYKKGSLYSMDTLMTRVYGKPKETTAVENSGKIEFVITKGKTIL